VSVSPEEFLSQSPSAFLNPPSFLEGRAQVAPTVEESPEFAKIAIGIAAAVVVLRMAVKHHLAQETPRTAQEIAESASRIYRRVFPLWLQAAVPAIAQAYRLGATSALSYSELEKMAEDYAADLGDYVHATSSQALVEGFSAQVNSGWNESLAWTRAREAYGLDSSQMRSYVKGLTSRDKTDYVVDPVPAASRAAVDRAFLFRADKLGTNEAFKATQVGRNLVWIAMEGMGDLPPGTLKMWRTAEDERVCEVCGPLDKVTIPLKDRFVTVTGEKFYAPGIHPSCRCELEMVYPDLGTDVVKAMSGDPYNRNADGEFATKESRGMLGGKGLLKQGLLHQGLLEDVKGEVEGKGLLESRDSGLLNRMTFGGLLKESAGGLLGASAGGLLGKEEAEEAEEAKAAESRGMLAAAPAKAARIRQAKLTRTLRPDDPQEHDTTFYMSADAFLKATGVSRETAITPGAPIVLGETHPTSGTHWAAGFSQTYDSALEDSPAFDKAFNDFMDTMGNELYQDKKTSDDSRDKTLSAFGKFGDNDDLRHLFAERKALANQSKSTLRNMALAVRDSSKEALQAVEGSPLMDDEWLEDSSASDIANEIMWAVKSEEDLSASHHARFQTWRETPWRTRVEALREINDDDLTIGMRGMDSSSRFSTQPIFFRVPKWYGVELGQGLDREARGEGHYVVDKVRTYRVPPSVNETQVQEIMDDIVVVTLKYDKPPKG
jgi:hypothetical protein